MPQSPVFAMILVAVAGAAIALQTPINAALGRQIASTLGAATISFGVGFVLLLTVTVIYGDGARLAGALQAPAVLLTGGMLGAFLVWGTLWAVPVLGVLTLTAVLILGQIVAALVIDQLGLFGLVPRDISLTRVLAAVLVGAGVILSRF
jgi:transporter family-2 protein